MNTRKHRGPSVAPSRTPDVTLVHFENDPFRTTRCSALSKRKDANHEFILSPFANEFSFCSKRLCDTGSNAFRK